MRPSGGLAPDLNPNLIVWHGLQWIGTPWAAGQSCRGAGADCVGLALGVWRELTGLAVPRPGWRDDWPAGRVSPLLDGVRGYARPVPFTAARPGHLAVFRRAGRAVHLGVMVAPGQYLEAASLRAVRLAHAPRASSLWALPACPGAVTGPVDLTPGDCLAVVMPHECGGFYAEITHQLTADLLARTPAYPSVSAALDHLGAIYPHIEVM